MTDTDGALARFVDKVSNTYTTTKLPVRTSVDFGKQVFFAVFDVSPLGTAAQVGNLNHSGEFAAYKQRRFNYSQYGNPRGAAVVKCTHHSRLTSSNRFVVVMNKKTERPLAIVGLISVFEVAFKAGNELFKACSSSDRRSICGLTGPCQCTRRTVEQYPKRRHNWQHR